MPLENACWISQKPTLYPYSKLEMLTLDDITFYSKILDEYLTVKRGFNTDGASVPWLFQWKFKPWDNQTIRSAILHDYLYVMHDYDPDFTMDRKMADAILLESLASEGFEYPKLYYGVSYALGGPLWRLKQPKADVEEWVSLVKYGSEDELDDYIENIIYGSGLAA